MNLFEEALFAIRLHGFDGATGLELATLGGARALGMAAEVGSLEVGRWADLAVVDVSPGDVDPAREVLEAAAGGAVTSTIVGGAAVYDSATETTG